MKDNPLSIFEWHDLPLESYTISSTSIKLLVTPYDDERQEYLYYELTLSDFRLCHMVSDMKLTAKTLKNMEVTNFTYTISKDRLSGTLDIYPENTGHFSLKLEDCRFELNPI